MNKNITYFFAGILLTLIILWGVFRLSKIGEPETINTSYILRNQITNMNKMVVVEQDFSSIEKHKVSYEFLGNEISQNEVSAFVKTKAQVSYDLNKMVIDIDSINKKLIIEDLPDPQITIIPSVEIQSMDDSFFNRIDEKQIKNITQSAKENAINRVNREDLKRKGEIQLKENLQSIFVLAKALGYEIVDNNSKSKYLH